jgi:serine/threonine-protein kinase
MGEVWAATNDQPGGRRDVAIKVLLARAAMKPDLVRRFEREARIASAIQSPFVCQLLEVAEAEDGAHLLVFEHLSGESLADRLKREQYLPFSEVGPIIEDVLQGLAAAHDAGVIHRDLKPGNIFLEQRPAHEGEAGYAPPSGGFGFSEAAPPPEERRERAKILDFGISKLTRREEKEPTLTAFDATLGSFAYMAPEQVRGAARADERADIYAVGSVAFRALSGRLPFEGNSAAVLVAMKLERHAPSLAEVTSDQWPAGIERFLERALSRKREGRFESATEALKAWRAVCKGLQRVPYPAPPPAPEVAPLPPPRAIPAAPPIPGPAARPSQQAMPRPAPPSRRPKAIPAPTKPVAVPPPRAPMQSYQVIEDSPTDVDGPPEMTVDTFPAGDGGAPLGVPRGGRFAPAPPAPAPPYPLDPRETSSKRRKTGRP